MESQIITCPYCDSKETSFIDENEFDIYQCLGCMKIFPVECNHK